MGAKNRTRAAGIIAIPIAIVLVAVFLSAGTSFALVMMEKNKFTRELPVESPNGDTCTSWDGVSFQVQSKIEAVGKQKGIHPAFIASIYWKENGKKFRDIDFDFPCEEGGCGPFQITNWAGRYPKSTIMSFNDSIIIAVDKMKSMASASGMKNTTLSTENEVKAMALAYNRGPGVAKKWVQAGFPELTAAKIFEYQKGFPVYDNNPVGNPGDFYQPPRHEHTQWWYAEVAHDYVQDLPAQFKKMNCQKATATGSCGTRIIQIAEGEVGKKYNNDCTPYMSTCDAWCAGFASWVYKKAGYLKNITPGTTTLLEKTGELKVVNVNGDINQIKPGDIFWKSRGRNLWHVGIVEATGNGKVNTIEGNVGNTSNDVDQVARRSHPVSNIVYVARPISCSK